jgi:hypothetical protein
MYACPFTHFVQTVRVILILVPESIVHFDTHMAGRDTVQTLKAEDGRVK